MAPQESDRREFIKISAAAAVAPWQRRIAVTRTMWPLTINFSQKNIGASE